MILHVELDDVNASVEERGEPLIVGGAARRRTITTVRPIVQCPAPPIESGASGRHLVRESR